jgi:hypothetical protein
MVSASRCPDCSLDCSGGPPVPLPLPTTGEQGEHVGECAECGGVTGVGEQSSYFSTIFCSAGSTECAGVSGVFFGPVAPPAPAVKRSARRLKTQHIRFSLRLLRCLHLSILPAILAHDADVYAFFQKFAGGLSTAPVAPLSFRETDNRREAIVGLLLLVIEQQLRSCQLLIPQRLTVLV